MSLICCYRVHCTVCAPGETQRCMKCSGINELHCDVTGRVINCDQHVSSCNTVSHLYSHTAANYQLSAT